MLKEGIKGTQEVVVSEENTAKTMGSGALDVFATPAMIALMEKTAWESVQPYLEEGSGIRPRSGASGLRSAGPGVPRASREWGSAC